MPPQLRVFHSSCRESLLPTLGGSQHPGIPAPVNLTPPFGLVRHLDTCGIHSHRHTHINKSLRSRLCSLASVTDGRQEGKSVSCTPHAPLPSPAAPGTHVWMSVAEEFVEDVAELPAQHGVAGQGQPINHGPKCLRPFLMVGAQDAG